MIREVHPRESDQHRGDRQAQDLDGLDQLPCNCCPAPQLRHSPMADGSRSFLAAGSLACSTLNWHCPPAPPRDKHDAECEEHSLGVGGGVPGAFTGPEEGAPVDWWWKITAPPFTLSTPHSMPWIGGGRSQPRRWERSTNSSMA